MCDDWPDLGGWCRKFRRFSEICVGWGERNQILVHFNCLMQPLPGLMQAICTDTQTQAVFATVFNHSSMSRPMVWNILCSPGAAIRTALFLYGCTFYQCNNTITMQLWKFFDALSTLWEHEEGTRGKLVFSLYLMGNERTTERDFSWKYKTRLVGNWLVTTCFIYLFLGGVWRKSSSRPKCETHRTAKSDRERGIHAIEASLRVYEFPVVQVKLLAILSCVIISSYVFFSFPFFFNEYWVWS